jgi:uncharacterized protein
VALLLDTNILIYGLQEEAPEHAVARAWLTDALRSEAVAVTSAALTGLFRVASSQRIFNRPDLAGALAMADGLIAGGAQQLEPAARHWPIFRELCLRHGLSGNEIPDAHLAAVAIEHDATLVTHDRGFDRFAELRTLDPIEDRDHGVWR